MSSDYILLNTGFMIENHIKATPYTIVTKSRLVKLATSVIFMKDVSTYVQTRHAD